MGESTFSLWSGQGGFIANGSQIDETGWDFFVEFPYPSNPFSSPIEIHKAPLECKVQVKATNQRKKKLPITLSNLRRLATAQMPTFYVFIEFDGRTTAQRAYIVHVDKEIITNVLAKLHKIEQNDKENKFNKRTMTIHYDDTHLVDAPDGEKMKERILQHVGDDVAAYIADKNAHLKSTGYEDSYGSLTFTTEGKEAFSALIDASLGIEKEIDITNITSVASRFNIPHKTPFLQSDKGKVKLTPSSSVAGKIIFKEDVFTAGLSFDIQLFNSPFNDELHKDIAKSRIKGEFFDIFLNPYTGVSSCTFSITHDKKYNIKKLIDAFQLMKLLSSSKKHIAELHLQGNPKITYASTGAENEQITTSELKVLECAHKIITHFKSQDTPATISELIANKMPIYQLYDIIYPSSHTYKFSFIPDSDSFDATKKTTVVTLVVARIGNGIFGLIVVFIGTPEAQEDGSFEGTVDEFIIEKEITTSKEEADAATEALEIQKEIVSKKYEEDYNLIINQ